MTETSATATLNQDSATDQNNSSLSVDHSGSSSTVPPDAASPRQPLPDSAPHSTESSTTEPTTSIPASDTASSQVHNPTEQLVPPEYRPRPEKVVIEWTAPNRPFKKRKRQYYTTLGMIVLLIGLILFFANQFMLIAVLLSVAFLAYILSSIPPETITNQITTYGIRTDQQLFYWDELGTFWYDQRHKQRILFIQVMRFPFRLTLLLGDQSEAEVTEILSQVLLQKQPPASTFDKAAAWLQEKIPLDTES